MTEDTTPPPPPPSPEPTPEPASPPPPADELPVAQSEDDKTMAMLAHLLGIVLGFLGPLIIWLVKKDQSKFVDDQGKEALNFQLTMLIGWAIIIAITVITCGFGVFLSVPLGFGLAVVIIVFNIIGGLKAKEGVAYRYPFNIRMVK